MKNYSYSQKYSVWSPLHFAEKKETVSGDFFSSSDS